MKETIPVRFAEANADLTSDMDNVKSLPCRETRRAGEGKLTVTCWRIPFLRRLKVLLTGRVWLCVYGDVHPPLYIETDVFESTYGGTLA